MTGDIEGTATEQGTSGADTVTSGSESIFQFAGAKTDVSQEPLAWDVPIETAHTTRGEEPVVSLNTETQDPPLVSVIILNYQGIQFIQRCLETVLDSGYPRLEIMVVDNGSTDDSMRIARAYGERVICIENGKNLGFAAGCNVGIRESHGDIVLLLNVDTMVRENWVESLVEQFVADEQVALAGSRLLFLDGSTIQHAGGVVEPNGMCRHRGYGEKDDGRYKLRCEVDYLTGASLAIRRSALDEVGLLDEGYFFYYDDVDLASEMKKHGYSAVYVPESVVLHFETFGIKKKSFAYYKRFHRGRIRYILKQFGVRYFFMTFLRAEFHWYRYSDFWNQAPGLFAAYATTLPKAPWLWTRGFIKRFLLRRRLAKAE